jgi:hypothetical protein
MRIFFKFRHWALVIGHSVFALCAFAQPETPPKPATLRFLFLDESAGAYSLKIDRNFQQISAAPYAISPPYVPASLRSLEIYKTNPIPNPETGAIERIKIATLVPPANTTSALVIVTPRPASPGSTEPPVYQVEFVNSDPATFPGGAIRILNRGQSAMAGRFSTEQVMVAPGSTKIIRPAFDDRGRVRMRIAVQVQSGDNWKQVDRNVAILKPDIRVTGVLVYSPSGMRHLYDADTLLDQGVPSPGHFWLTYTDTP